MIQSSDIELLCFECGRRLVATPEPPVQTANPPPAFRVGPCRECLAKANDEGWNDGYEQGCKNED